MKKIILCMLFVTVSFFTISYCGNFPHDCIIGNWQSLYSDCEDNRTLTITDSQLITTSSFFKISHSYILDSVSPDGSINLRIFDPRYNGLNISTDTSKVTIYLEKEIMVLLFWKGGPVSEEYQISIAYTRENGNTPKNYQPTISSTFILPESFTGSSWVALEQPDGESAGYDENGRSVFTIPDSGLLLTKSNIMPAELAKRSMAFYFKTSDEFNPQPIPVISDNCFLYFSKQKLTDEQIKQYSFDPDKIYAYYFRYNIPARGKMNEFFKKEIKGQVFWFRVDTLRNLLKPEMAPRIVEY